MSALPDQGQFKTAVDQPFFIVATLWRGAMVERFARIEFFVDRSIEACAAAGIAPAKHCSDHFPMKRIEKLLLSLEDGRLVSCSKLARDSLLSIKDSWHRRNAICHGRMRILKRSVRIESKTFLKGGSQPACLSLTDVQMLAILARMDRVQTVLGSQLGMVDKTCSELRGNPV